MSNTGCEYCNDLLRKKVISEGDICICDQLMHIVKTDLFPIKIHYCPMCGTKLQSQEDKHMQELKEFAKAIGNWKTSPGAPVNFKKTYEALKWAIEKLEGGG